MLHLSVNGQVLDLDPRSRVTLRGSNPAFERDGVGRIWSQPFRLPASGRNLSVLQHAVRLDSADRGAETDAQLHLDGLPFMPGVLAVGEVTDGSLEVVFRSMPRQWLTEMERFRIEEILESFDIAQTVEPEFLAYLTTGGGEWDISINNEVFSSSAGDLLTAATELATAINLTFPGLATVYNSGGNIGLMLDQTQIELMQLSVTPSSGWNIIAFRTAAEAQRDNFAAHMDAHYDTPADSHRWPVVRDTQFYADNVLFSWFVNYRRGGELGINTPQAKSEWEYNWAPFVRVAYIFERIRARLTGIVEFTEFFEDVDFDRALVWNNYALDDVVNSWDMDDGLLWLNQHVTTYDLNKHVPRMEARQFWDEIMAFFNLYVLQDGETVQLKKRIDQLSASPLDWTRQLVSGFSYEKQRERGFTMHFREDKFDSFSSPQFDDYAEGLGELRIEVARPLGMETINEPKFLLVNWRNASIKQRGSSDGPRQEKRADFALRLFFDNGKTTDMNGNEYWMSSADGVDIHYNPIGVVSLMWDGEVGMYASYFQGWAGLMANGQPVKFSVRLMAHELISLLRWETPVVVVRHPLGQVRIIVSEIETPFVAEATHYETEVTGIIL